MNNQAAKDLAESGWSLVVAPAGCGKTHLIADSVKHTKGRQLILTHTHAGVRSMINHLKRIEIPSKQYTVCTIDSLALKYACAFPLLSGWDKRQPFQEDWQLICPAAAAAFKQKAVKKVLTSTYSGIYVDEYQDCSSDQHELITLIADYLPCRIVGDPLQSIFWEVNKTKSIDWVNIEHTFQPLFELSTPWRWKNKNEKLGEWLLSVRKSLENGNPINLQESPVEWIKGNDQQSKIKACYQSLNNKKQTVVAIQKWSNQCHHLARYLKNTFSSMEPVECEDLLKYTQKFEEATGMNRVAVFSEFTCKCISSLPTGLKNIMDRIAEGLSVKPKRDDFKLVAANLQNISKSNELSLIYKAMISIGNVDAKLVYARRELWKEMKKTLQSFDQSECTLTDRAWGIRDVGRRIGREIQKKCISTTLLIKGLEFDHAILLDADQLDSAENLYVAMTRGCNSLTVLSRNPVIQCGKPRHLL